MPIYILFYTGWASSNTYAALVLPFTISVFGIFLMRQFFMTVPDDLIDAARIDGMTRIRHRLARDGADGDSGADRLRHLLGGRALERLFLAADRGRQRASVHAAARRSRFLNNEDGTDYGPLMAAATIVIAPLVIAFLIAQRRFIEGITFTGVK